ncbi:MAG: hypothetical protein EXS37_07945 [Opitutus sp.]|nr:hypothetical protein [Opitutus sp.]
MHKLRPPATAIAPPSWHHIDANLLALVVGIAVGGIFSYLGRRLLAKKGWEAYPQILAVLDAAIVVLAGVLTSSMDLWKRAAWLSLDPYTLAGYGAAGGLLAGSLGMKWIITVTKESTKATVEALKTKVLEIEKSRDAKLLEVQAEATGKIQALEKERDRVLRIEAVVGEVMQAKLDRLVAELQKKEHGSLAAALAPELQIHRLIQVLHGHIAKQLRAGSRLRVGIYLLDDDKVTLTPAFSWDGEKNKVFSGKYAEYMKITAHGRAHSAVVQAWGPDGPFIFIGDGEEAERAGRFRYFNPGQRQKIRSMVAYCHYMKGPTPDDAFVISLDSDQAGFFSGDVEVECRLLAPAFSRRIELELLASFLAPNQQPSPNPPT